jgi:hypothetical protein
MALKLTFDVTTGRIVAYNGSSAGLPPLRQGLHELELRFVQPTANSIPGVPAYEPIDLDDYNGPRLGVWSNTTFTEADSTDHLLALSTEFTLNTDDADDPYYTATLDLNTSEVAALSGKTSAAYCAVSLVRTSDLAIIPVFDHQGVTNCTLYSATDDGFAALASSASANKPINLPLTVKDESSGEIYELTRTSAGTLTWVWTNAP